MKRKVGLRIDATLYQQAKSVARRQGRSVDTVIEEALNWYVARSGSRPFMVEQTRGAFRVPEATLRAVLKEDLI